MDGILSMVTAMFGFLNDNDLFGIPLLYILIGIAVLGLIISFVAGKKE